MGIRTAAVFLVLLMLVMPASAEDKFSFTWTPLIESISHKEYLITTDKTADIAESFSVFFNETSFMIEDIRNVRLYLEKSFSWNETVFITIEEEQTCYDENNHSYICLKIVSVPNGTIEKIGYKWNEIGFLVKEKTNKDAKIKYDVKKFKKHDRYKLTFDTPIQTTKTGFGSTGLVAFLVDGEIHHPLWDTTGWTKYRKINITNNVAIAITNYQFLSNISYDTDMRADFGDLRFVWVNNSDSTDERELNYFIEDKIDSSYAYIWINNTYIPASSSVIIKMFYGNAEATNNSNASNVFNLYETFTDGDYTQNPIWTVAQGTWQVIGGAIHTTSSGTPDEIRTSIGNLTNFALSADCKNGAGGLILEMENQTRANSYVVYSSGTIYNLQKDAGASNIDTATRTSDPSNYHKFEMRRDENGLLSYLLDGIVKGSGTDTEHTTLDRVALESHATDTNYFDNITLRQYVSTEPSHSIGAEQDVPIGDPIVKLTFDLANGLDASEYGNNAEITSAQWVYSDKCAGAYNMSAAGRQISLFTAMLNKTYTNFAYCVRAKGAGKIFDASSGIAEPRKLMLIRYSDGRIYYSVNDVVENYNTTNVYGEWESFCLSSNGINQQFYFNGLEVHTSSNAENLPLNTTLYFGTPYINTTYYGFAGQVDDFYFWNRTITAAEALSFNTSCDNNLDLAAYDAITNETLAGYALQILNADYANIPTALNLTLAPGNYSLIFSLVNYSSKSAAVGVINTSFYNASLYPLKLFECGIYEGVIPTLNFSVYDEELLLELNGTIELIFNLLEEGFYATNQSWNLTSTPLTICIPENVTYTITDSIIQYNAPGHTLRHYFLMNFSINSTMQSIPLYSLATANGTEITINIQDAAGSPVSNAIIIFQRYYIGEDVYKAVAMARTDYNGQAVTNVRQGDVWHKLLILKDLIVKRAIDRMIITETTLNIPYVDEGAGQEFYTYYNNIAATCTANTSIVVCTAIDTTGASQEFQLDVYRIGYNNVGRVLTCTDTETSTSATLSCPVSNNNSYYTLSVIGSHYRLYDGYINTPTATYGVNGVILGAGVVMTMVGIGAFNPVAAIGLGLVGLVLAVLTDIVVMKAAALISLILVGIILIVKMRS